MGRICKNRGGSFHVEQDCLRFRVRLRARFGGSSGDWLAAGQHISRAGQRPAGSTERPADYGANRASGRVALRRAVRFASHRARHWV